MAGSQGHAIRPLMFVSARRPHGRSAGATRRNGRCGTHRSRDRARPPFASPLLHRPGLDDDAATTDLLKDPSRDRSTPTGLCVFDMPLEAIVERCSASQAVPLVPLLVQRFLHRGPSPPPPRRTLAGCIVLVPRRGSLGANFRQIASGRDPGVREGAAPRTDAMSMVRQEQIRQSEML